MRKIMDYVDIIRIKHDLLGYEAQRWVGITEQGSDNNGQLVKIFQKTVDGRASGEPWCLAFIMYCLQQVDKVVDVFVGACLESSMRSHIYRTESVSLAYKHTPEICRIKNPIPGSLIIWQHGSTSSWHAEIVIDQRPGFPAEVWTVGANTSSGRIAREEFDGVYLRSRHVGTIGNMKLIGLLDPWPSAG